MTLSRQVAVYETAFVAYAVIGIGFAVYLYLWFRSILQGSAYFQNMLKGRPHGAFAVQVFVLSLSAALGAGWFMGAIALLIARTISQSSQMRVALDSEMPSDDVERIMALFEYDDAAQGLVMAIVMAIRASGPVVTKKILDVALANWSVFLPRTEPPRVAGWDPDYNERDHAPAVCLADLACPKCGCHMRQHFDCNCGAVHDDYCLNCGRFVSLPADESIELEVIDVRCAAGRCPHDHPAEERAARIALFFGPPEGGG